MPNVTLETLFYLLVYFQRYPYCKSRK